MTQRFCYLLLFFTCLAPSSFALPTPGLPGALQATLQNHPAIKGKQAEVAAQGYQVETVQAARYPNLSGQINTQESGDEYASLRLRQPLWAFGKIDTPIELAQRRLQVEKVALLQLQRQMVEKTAAAYARLIGVKQRLRVAEENVAEHNNLYERIERRQAGQLASPADVRLAGSRLMQAKAQRERLAGELQVATEELQSLTQVVVEVGESVEPLYSTLPEMSVVKEEALRVNADIQYKRELIEVAKSSAEQARVASTPTVYAEAERDFFDSPLANQTRLGIRLEGSIDGAGLGDLGRVKAASSQVEAARQDLSLTNNDVQLRISSLITNLNLQSVLKASLLASVEAVTETRESFVRQYESGLKSWLDVLNLQREMTEQQLLLVQADSDWLTLSLRLAALIGRLDGVAGVIQPAPTIK